jgi:HAD superfamily hydrolase (TIGR01484 family)
MADASILKNLLDRHTVVIITGGEQKQIEKQIVSSLPKDSNWKNLILFPASGATCVAYDEQGIPSVIYADVLGDDLTAQIRKALDEVTLKYPKPETVYGEVVQDRKVQITYSALGADAPEPVKKTWDPELSKRNPIADELRALLPQCEVRMGGHTSIDITKKGFDKYFAIQELIKRFNVKAEEVVFFGDALFPGGNDRAVPDGGIDTVAVKEPKDTFGVLSNILGFFAPYAENRPWGAFKRFTYNEESTVKIISVKKGEELSWQYHHERREFWRILSGNPAVLVGDKWFEGVPGDEFYIAREMVHAIGAPHNDVEFMEIALGHFDENDIVRIKDRYNRI